MSSADIGTKFAPPYAFIFIDKVESAFPQVNFPQYKP